MTLLESYSVEVGRDDGPHADADGDVARYVVVAVGAAALQVAGLDVDDVVLAQVVVG